VNIVIYKSILIEAFVLIYFLSVSAFWRTSLCKVLIHTISLVSKFYPTQYTIYNHMTFMKYSTVFYNYKVNNKPETEK